MNNSVNFNSIKLNTSKARIPFRHNATKRRCSSIIVEKSINSQRKNIYLATNLIHSIEFDRKENLCSPFCISIISIDRVKNGKFNAANGEPRCGTE